MAIAQAGGMEACEPNEWVAAMRAGDFGRAWLIADRDLARLIRSGRDKHAGPRHKQRIWRGEEMRGKKVLVRCYHGLGDTIQFVRFVRSRKRWSSGVSLNWLRWFHGSMELIVFCRCTRERPRSTMTSISRSWK